MITTMGQCRCPLQISVPDLATESVSESILQGIKDKARKRAPPFA